MTLALWILVLLLTIAVLLAAWRFFVVRTQGTTVIIRRLPAGGAHGWRHGLIRYTGEQVNYFKLRSLSPSPDLTFDRQGVEILSRREPRPEEAAFMADGLHIITIKRGEDTFEVALDDGTEMAMRAWVEAAPDVRQEKIDVRAMRARITQDRRHR